MSRNFQDQEVLLKFNNRFLDDPTLMRELNDHGDNLIAMEAVKRCDQPARAPRQPLQPSITQIAAKPASASPGPEPLKRSLELDRRYTSPYAPRPNTPAALSTSGSAVSNPNVSPHGDRKGSDWGANRGPAKSPLSERSMNPQGNGDARHDMMGHRGYRIQRGDEALSTTAAKASEVLAKDPLLKVESLMGPNILAAAHHDGAHPVHFKQQSPKISDGTTPVSSRR